MLPGQSRIRENAQSSGLALWGAGAKGVTFANLVDPQPKAHRLPRRRES